MAEEKIAGLKTGERLEVSFTDPGARPDLEAWCRANGHTFAGFRQAGDTGFATISKGK